MIERRHADIIEATLRERARHTHRFWGVALVQPHIHQFTIAGTSMDAGLRHVLEAAFPGAEDRYFLPMSIGNAPETADEGAALILNGTKTLTSSPFWDYPDGKIPFVGALSVVLDGARRPRGIVETVRVGIMPVAAPGNGEFLQVFGSTSQRGVHR